LHRLIQPPSIIDGIAEALLEMFPSSLDGLTALLEYLPPRRARRTRLFLRPRAAVLRAARARMSRVFLSTDVDVSRGLLESLGILPSLTSP
jgi:hypothetical protein